MFYKSTYSFDVPTQLCNKCQCFSGQNGTYGDLQMRSIDLISWTILEQTDILTVESNRSDLRNYVKRNTSNCVDTEGD